MIGLLHDGEILRLTQTNMQQPVALCVHQEGEAQITTVIEELTPAEFEQASKLLQNGSVVRIHDVRGAVA